MREIKGQCSENNYKREMTAQLQREKSRRNTAREKPSECNLQRPNVARKMMANCNEKKST